MDGWMGWMEGWDGMGWMGWRDAGMGWDGWMIEWMIWYGRMGWLIWMPWLDHVFETRLHQYPFYLDWVWLWEFLFIFTNWYRYRYWYFSSASFVWWTSIVWWFGNHLINNPKLNHWATTTWIQYCPGLRLMNMTLRQRAWEEMWGFREFGDVSYDKTSSLKALIAKHNMNCLLLFFSL